MSDYDNTDKGALFPNQYKEDGDNKPDYLGNVNVGGEDWRVAAWASTSKNGKEYLSLRISEPKESSNESANNSTKSTDDNIPF